MSEIHRRKRQADLKLAKWLSILGIYAVIVIAACIGVGL